MVMAEPAGKARVDQNIVELAGDDGHAATEPGGKAPSPAPHDPIRNVAVLEIVDKRRPGRGRAAERGQRCECLNSDPREPLECDHLDLLDVARPETCAGLGSRGPPPPTMEAEILGRPFQRVTTPFARPRPRAARGRRVNEASTVRLSPAAACPLPSRRNKGPSRSAPRGGIRSRDWPRCSPP